MTRNLPNTDEGDQYIQWRGRQTSVTVDDYGLLFRCEPGGRHVPLPVVEPDAEDPPANAVARPVAEALTDANPLVNWGIVCEQMTEDGDVCGDVFASPKALNSHKGVHTDGSDNDTGSNEGET